MKRTHEDGDIKLLYLDCVPDEIIGKILAFRYPSFTRKVKQTKSVFKLRESSTRLRKVIDLYLLGGVTMLGRAHSRLISDDAISLFTGLKKVYLSNSCQITSYGLQKMPWLRELSLRNNHTITDESLKMLPQLHKLSILDNPGSIDGSGLCHLTNLVTLNISGNGIISDENLSTLSGLTSLNIESNDDLITSKSLEPFKKSLCYINIVGSDIQLLDLLSFESLKEVYTDYRTDDNGIESLQNRGVEVIKCRIRGYWLY